MNVKKLLEQGISSIGYPQSALSLINRYSNNTTLDVASTARISRGCQLRGSITLEPRSRLGPGCELSGDIKIGQATNFEPRSQVVGDVSFGKYNAIARENIFQQKNHVISQPAMQMRFYEEVLDSKLEHTSKGPIKIKNDVWIGTRCIILSGVTLGDGAVIGAGSVVTDDVEPYSVVAGTPAKHIKWRFPKETREKLTDIAWWDWDIDKIRKNSGFFNRDINDVSDLRYSGD